MERKLGEKRRRLAGGQARSDEHAASVRRLLQEAQAAWQSGAVGAALERVARAVSLVPNAHELRYEYARALQQAGRLEPAAQQLQAACALRPDVPQYWEGLGIVQQSLGETQGAAESYRRAQALQPSAALKLKQATLVSPIIASRESMLAERAAMEGALESLLADAPAPLEDPMRLALWPNFYWAYHGLPNRDLQAKAAAVYRRFFPSLEYVAPHCRAPEPPRERRIRVGFISQFLHNHSIGRTSRGFFAELARERFEAVALLIAPVVDDAYSRFIRAEADRALEVPRELAAARRLIESLELDVLFYQDIGMEPFSYFLAFSRLAPVQCVSFGHPDTTGIPTIDYFVSNDLYETPGSAAHYSERLFELRGLGTLAYYYRPEGGSQRKTRADFGLDPEHHLYVCPQNLFKFHPDMDELIAGILRGDPKGRLVAIEGRVARWTELLKRRWADTMPDVVDRIVFLPRMGGEDYLSLVEASDVMLDTVHFNGMNTSLEAFAAGIPVVTLPGALQRGRHTQAMYRRMGLEEAIARDAADYIERAVRLGTDASARAALAGEIRKRNGALFEDPVVVREFERFFEEATCRPSAPA